MIGIRIFDYSVLQTETDTISLLGTYCRFLNETYSKVPQGLVIAFSSFAQYRTR